ncbi:MAG: transporter substrate-binding domain-containing protein, partial [Deltaproteobacteria bacterium]|nr:transporter substrate-binding domain-containing protein [Deltaproteobacteria bacterium]
MRASQLFCLFLGGILLLCAPGCEKTRPTALPDAGGEEPVAIADYRGIPGVTQEEIAAITALREQRKRFVYGMSLSTEAFYDESGKIGGFSRLLCDWLTDIFQIPFEPALYEWGDLLDGMESRSIDFSGELTATEERRGTYFMTGAIAERSVKYMRISNDEALSRIAKTRPLRYAFLNDTTTYLQVAPFIEKAEAFFLSDYPTAHKMLVSGEIDAFFDEGCAEAAFDSYGDVTAETFFPLLYSAVSLSTRNPELAPIISVVQKALQSGATLRLTRFYNRGYQDYLRHKLLTQLTETERAYLNGRIEANRAVSVAVEYDNYPSSFYNGYEEMWQGIAFDV